MKVFLITKNGISKVSIPKNVNGSYWLKDMYSKEETNSIQIYNNDGKLEIISNDYESATKSIHIEKDTFYKIAATHIPENFNILYCT